MIEPEPIPTPITEMLGIRYPIVVAPMFLVSTPALLQAVAEAGGIAVIPSLNFRTHEAFEAFLRDFPDLPFGVNLILKDNPRLADDLKAIRERRVPLIVTSLGDPTEVIEQVHAYGGRVFSDVVNLRHAQKAARAGADALVAVAAGAGGHAGTVSPFVLAPWIREETGLPVLVAGGLADGRHLLAALALGDAGYFGTRFIATHESGASEAYKRMLLEAGPEDVVYTPEVTGVPANFLKASLERFRAGGKPWKEVFSAGHGVAFVREVEPAGRLVHRIAQGYHEARRRLP